jgi:predicted GNAT family N-acyltransferase
VEEQQKLGYAELCTERKLVDPLDDDEADQLYIQGDTGQVIACLRLNWGETTTLPEYLAEGYQLGRLTGIRSEQILYVSRLIIAPEARRSAAILELPLMAYRLSRERGVQVAFLNSSADLIPMYKRLGYRLLGQTMVDPAVGLRYPMLLLLEDLSHLHAVNSPFLRLAPREPNPFVAWFHQSFPDLFDGKALDAAA